VIYGKGFTIKESKFDYFFGRVTSDPDNTKRSLQNLRELRRLGIDEALGGRERLLQLFEEGLNAPEISDRRITKYGINITRQVEVTGSQESGAILISYYYPEGNLSTTPQVTSIIPKIYQ
jgi:hypothetical protein